MPELFFEILTEEIPARMQVRAAEELAHLFQSVMMDHGYPKIVSRGYVTPRRLVVHAPELIAERPARVSERRGPRVGAADAAIEGFLTACGLKSLAECRQVATEKGDFWFADFHTPACVTAVLLPQAIATCIKTLAWPKSMRWGAGSQTWVRPIVDVMAVYDGEPLVVEGWERVPRTGAPGTTKGHRFMAPDAIIAPQDFLDYQQQLCQASVVLDHAERRELIVRQLDDAAHKRGFSVVSDEGLLDEVAGLVEWPHVLIGAIDEEHMALPKEVLQVVMRHHQRYFTMHSVQGELAPVFAAVANIVPRNGGALAVKGYERVLRARLADATFFWREDLAKPLQEHAKRLNQLTFHAKLGTIADKVARLRRMAPWLANTVLAPVLGIHSADGFRELLLAIDLCKADLCTQMVRELPELQGVMGRCYAQLEGHGDGVSYAIEHHYAPQGQHHEVPKWPLSMALALLDKIDTLVGFFAIQEKPTGSKDPYALRRAALGILRIALENNLVDLDLRAWIAAHAEIYHERGITVENAIVDDVLEFLSERLRVYLRDRGVRHDVIGAALRHGDNPVWGEQSARALQGFLSETNGHELLQAFKRSANILKNTTPSARVEKDLFAEEEEHVLWQAFLEIEHQVESALAQRPLPRYRDAFLALGRLHQPLADFFDQVTVNAEEPAVRANRQAILQRVRSLFDTIADFSALES